MRTNGLRLTATFLGLLLLSSCQDDSKKAAAPAMPPQKVAVITTKTESLPITNDLPGRIAPTRLAEVRPRVSGILVQRVFEQGSIVKAGDVLYRIDPAPFQVQMDSANATLRRAKAGQLQARQTADRQEQLRRSKVNTQQQYDEATALLAQADAEVAVADAGVAAAALNLQYANVTAPISGRIGRALITEGALVSATGSENLATIQQLDPVYADFTQSATDLIRLRRALEAAGAMGTEKEASVELLMDDGSKYPHKGKLLFSEASVDATTGQVTLRGEFPNPEDDLLPGMYVRVLIEQGIAKDAIAIPQQAVQRDTAGNAQIYVVKADKSTELRRVQTGRNYGSRILIADGLKAGEQVIVEGFQKVRPGATVEPAEWTADADREAAANAVKAPGAAASAAKSEIASQNP